MIYIYIYKLLLDLNDQNDQPVAMFLAALAERALRIVGPLAIGLDCALSSVCVVADLTYNGAIRCLRE